VKRNKIILLGNTGEIGSFLEEKLSEDFDVKGFSPKNGFDLCRENDIKKIIVNNRDSSALINCAFKRVPGGSLQSYENDQMMDFFSANLFSLFNTLKYVSKYIDNCKYIYFSSIAVHGLEGQPIYSAVKGAAESLIKSCREELIKSRIEPVIVRLGPVAVERKNFMPEIRKQHRSLQEGLLNHMFSDEFVQKIEIYRLVKMILEKQYHGFAGETINLSGGYRYL